MGKWIENTLMGFVGWCGVILGILVLIAYNPIGCILEQWHIIIQLGQLILSHYVQQ